MAPRDVTVDLCYFVDDGEVGYAISNPPNDVLEVGTMQKQKVTIHDARGLGCTLENESFQLVEQTTSLSTEDFYLPPDEKITTVYYEEMRELVKKVTGAAHVVIVHHQVRNKDCISGGGYNDKSSIMGYATIPHSDGHFKSAEDVFKKLMAGVPALRVFRSGRFAYINIWRNISDKPIKKFPLAVCDAKSLVAPDDYMVTELREYIHDAQFMRLNGRNAERHMWYYFPEMTKQETLVMTHWDSDYTRRARVCFHSAFDNHVTDEEAPWPRESIEIRAFAFFPDHTPNTCPVIEDASEEAEKTDEDKQVDAAVQQVFKSIENLSVWPIHSLKWLQGELERGDDGLKAIATNLAMDDELGNNGLKKLPVETRKKIADALFSRVNFRRKIGGNFGKVLHKLK